MAAEDHLCLANQNAGDVDGLLVVVWVWKGVCVQSPQAHEEAAEAGKEELAAANPVGVALVLPCDGFTRRSGCRFRPV